MRKGKNAAAILGGAAAIMLFAASALSVFAFDSIKLEDRKDELTDGIINIVADEVYAAAGETVTFGVMVYNNTGYAGSGIALNYDSALTVVTDQTEKADVKIGAGADGLVMTDDLNLEKHIVGVSTMGDADCEDDGIIFTVQFRVPEDAAIGTKYPMTLNITKFLDYRTDPVDYISVDGWIQVRPKETTTATTTAVTTATTAATTATTAETTQATTRVTQTTQVTTRETTKPVTTSTTASAESMTSTTTSFEAGIVTSVSTKKTDRDPTQEATTPPRGGNNGNQSNTGTNTKADSVKTGDAGAGAAMAAFVLAGVSAVIFGRRKKD